MRTSPDRCKSVPYTGSNSGGVPSFSYSSSESEKGFNDSFAASASESPLQIVVMVTPGPRWASFYMAKGTRHSKNLKATAQGALPAA